MTYSCEGQGIQNDVCDKHAPKLLFYTQIV